MRIKFIINPRSGGKGKKSIPALIGRVIDKDKFDYDIRFTEYPGHAGLLAKEAVEEGLDAVVAVGGDGTVNEVARSLVHTDTALGVIPCGSGNGFARHVGIPMDLNKAIEFINESEVTTIDYGKINDVPFFCTCGMGFDALISYNFAKNDKRGYIGYIRQTLHDYIKYEPDVYEIEDETGTIKTKAFLIACGNASQYGNNFYIAPHASMKDGLLSVTILEPFPVAEAPLIVGNIFQDKIDRNRHIKTFNSRKIIIHRNHPGVVHYDGEPVEMEADVVVEVIPEGLHILSKRDWNGAYKAVSLEKQFRELVGIV